MDRAHRNVLDGSWRELSRPFSYLGFCASLAALAYGGLTFGAARSFRLLVLHLAATGGFLLLCELRALIATSELRAAARGGGGGGPEVLKRCLTELSSFPDKAFLWTTLHWLLACVAVGLLGHSMLGLSWAQSGRVVVVGALFGPLPLVLAHVLSVGRVRAVLESLADKGVSVSALVAALPSGKRRIRRRVLVFTFAASLCPTFLAADLAFALGREGMWEVANLPEAITLDVANQLRLRLALSLLLLMAVGVGVTVLAARWAGGALVRPLRDLAEQANRVARGDRRRGRLVAAEDELWLLSSSFSAMHEQLTRLGTDLTDAGVRAGTVGEQVVTAATALQQGATMQASSLNETSATTEELARSARQIAENAAEVATLAERTVQAAQGGQKSAEAFADAMRRMRQDHGGIAEAVSRLSKRVAQIGKIVEFITSIADRSDLLALNAELEGTRAGEVGRGFSLVASEMRRLAENVIESTNEIEALIGEIREATDRAVHTAEAGTRTTDHGAQVAQAVVEELSQILKDAAETSAAVQAISLATQHQQSGTDQLARTMWELLDVTRRSVEARKAVSAAHLDLANLAKDVQLAATGVAGEGKAS